MQKKLVYLYLCTYADTNAELSLLVVNTLQKVRPVTPTLSKRTLAAPRTAATKIRLSVAWRCALCARYGA